MVGNFGIKNWWEKRERKCYRYLWHSQSLTFRHPTPQGKEGLLIYINFLPCSLLFLSSCCRPYQKKVEKFHRFSLSRAQRQNQAALAAIICSMWLRSTGLNALSQPGCKSWPVQILWLFSGVHLWHVSVFTDYPWDVALLPTVILDQEGCSYFGPEFYYYLTSLLLVKTSCIL